VSDVAKIMSTEHYIDIMMQVREKLEQLKDESSQGTNMQPSYECVRVWMECCCHYSDYLVLIK